MTFACITVALVLGSIVDRMKFSAWILFTVLWVTFVYCPIAHWVWGKGWMAGMGRLTSPGEPWFTSTPRRRAGAGAGARQAHRLRQGGHVRPASALTALGAALLWFGWFGFNAGSASSRTAWPLGLPRHEHLGRRAAWRGCSSSGSSIKTDRARHRLGRRGGAGRHHPGGRVVGLGASILIGVARAPGVFLGGPAEAKARVRRLARRLRGARHVRHPRALATGLFADPAVNPPAPGFSSATPAVAGAAGVHPGHGGVHRRYDPALDLRDQGR